MKQEKKRTTLYLKPDSDCWLKEKAQKDGISKNDVIQLLINRAMENEKVQ